MTRHPTGTASPYGATDPALVDASALAPAKPGLVLLYAREHGALLPAYPFVRSSVVIGRKGPADVIVPEQAVSREHARIVYDGQRWILADLGSRNGTVVDGTTVTGQVELEHLQEIRVGDAVFKFVERDADRYAPYAIDGSMLGPRQSKARSSLVGGWQMDVITAELERIGPTPLSCVVLGETGTGKELAARELHRLSGRKGSLQAINCAAIPATLLESELFGYRRGAFSGADRDKPGLVKLADGGTLFLDEIGDMPLEAQAKLLRVLQSGEVFPLGATAAEKIDVRVVCATHRDLERHVRDGRFRGDLYARVSEHVVTLPPLRERKEDLFQLVKFFGERHGRADRTGGDAGGALRFSFSFLLALIRHDWPFNVRELESCVKRAAALADGDLIDVRQLPDSIASLMRDYGGKAPAPRPPGVAEARSAPPPRAVAPPEAELKELLQRHKGNVAAVGRELGKERMQIHRWMKRYGIRIDDYRVPGGDAGES